MKPSTVSIAVLLLATTGACAPRRPAASAAPTLARASAGERDTHEVLQAVLWMQTAAEYHVLAEGAYERASQLLDRALADRAWTAALEQENGGAYAGLPPAVVMDLDETVLDNSRFQGQLVLDRTVYESRLWTAWVDQAAATAVPGAIAFIRNARARGVRVIFVTNRTAAEERKTIDNLNVLLDGQTDPEDVLCVGERDWPSDKSSRRLFLASRYRILLLVGDDLNDFVSVAPARTPADRLALAEANAARWRDRWVLIPNAAYGSWDRVLTQGASSDADVLRQKRHSVAGFKEPSR